MNDDNETCALVRIAASLSTRHPLLVLFLSFTPSVICLLAMVIGPPLHIASVTMSDYSIWNDPRTEAYEARKAARSYFSVPLVHALDANTSRIKIDMERSLVILFRTSGWESRETPNSLLTTKNIAAMKRAEDAILHDRNFERFCFRAAPMCASLANCALPRSVLNTHNLYGLPSSSGTICTREPTSQALSSFNVSAVRASLYKDRDKEESDGGLIVWRDTTPWLGYTAISIGTPFSGFANDSDRPVDQSRLYSSWVVDVAHRAKEAGQPELDVYVLGVELALTRFERTFRKDTIYCVGALLAVFLLLTLYTRSIVLSGIAVGQVALAFPVAYVTYTYLFRIPYFGTLHLFAMYLLLGIAADDIFVFTHTWKQAALLQPYASLYIRMIWTYTQVIKAISVTSATTAASYLIMVASPIMPLSSSGLWASLLILVQFCLVCTAYPSALVLSERQFRINYGTYDETVVDSNSLTKSKWPRIRTVISMISEFQMHHQLENWFRGPFAAWILRWWQLLAVLAIAYFVTCGTLLSRLRLRDDLDRVFSPQHPEEIAYQQWRRNFKNTVTDGPLEISVTWGIVGIDRKGVQYHDRRNSGVAIMDNKFDLRSASAQRHLLTACNQLAQDPTLFNVTKHPKHPVRCWLRNFTQWRQSLGRVPIISYENNVKLIFDVTQFMLAPDPDNGQQKFLTYILRQDVLLSRDLTRMVGIEARFQLTQATIKEVRQAYKNWTKAVARLNEQAPRSAGNATVTAGLTWVYQGLQEELLQSLKYGVCIMLALTMVILTCMTRSVITGFLTTLAIAGIVSGLLIFVLLMGWRIGLTVSITVIVSIGYSFDGVAHFTMAYTHSSVIRPSERLRDALGRLGLPITFGALTTAASSAFLTATEIDALRKLGILIIVTMSLTLIMSLVMLPAVLIGCGSAIIKSEQRN